MEAQSKKKNTITKMNKVRINGIILIIIGISTMYFLEDEKFDILSGIILGLGLGLTITGRYRKSKKFLEN